MVVKFDFSNHVLVPKHEKLSEEDKKALLKKLNCSEGEFPKILKKDPGLFNLDVKRGDIIKITRESSTAGEVYFYRVVLDV